MIYDQQLSGEHREIFELLPWYLNGTIAETDRQKVDAHLRDCAACLAELAHERRVYETMAVESSLAFIPASLNHLQARLDALAFEEPSTASPQHAAGHEQLVRRRRHVRWPRLAAAALAVMAVALGVVSADRWMQFRARDWPSEYHTVTTSAPRPPGEVIRAVFAPNITLVELQAILDEAQLRIISGPTEAGVYSLAANSDRPVNSSLALLRRHAAVRFAESTRPPEPRAGSGPP